MSLPPTRKNSNIFFLQDRSEESRSKVQSMQS